MKDRDGQRLMTVKMTAMRSRSECVNASRNKHAGKEEAENKQKLLFQC